MTNAAAPPNENYDWDPVLERLRKRADEGFPPAWQHEEPGDELAGVLVAVKMQAPTAYGPAPVVTIEQPNTHTRYSVWLMHKVLRQAFEREAPQLGETVLIRYLGERRPEGGGNSYHDFRLVVDRPMDSGKPDWHAMAERYDDTIDNPVSTPKRPPETADDFADFGAADAEAEDIPF